MLQKQDPTLRRRRPVERKWWTLLAVLIGTFMLLLDVTIVNVALPKIQADLHSSLSDLQWVVDAYSLTLAALLLLAGSLADRYGRRRVFLGGLIVFSLASLTCGLAPDATSLNLARGVQGIGAAGMLATGLALIAQEFQGRERGTAIAAFGATIGGAVAIGPLAGGLLTEGLGWQWIFFVNVPIGALATVVALIRIAESRNPNPGPVDLSGFFTFSLSLFLLVFALLRGNADGWGSTEILACLIGSAVLMAAFIAIERRRPQPMFDLGLFRNPTFVGVSVATVALGAGMFAMYLYLTLYVQDVLGLTPLQAGLRFLPNTLPAFIVPAATRNLGARVPARILLGTGMTLVGVGLLLMHGLTVNSGWTALLAGFIVAGTGVGLANPTLASAAIGVVPVERSGMASGINSTCRLAGVAAGVGALGAIFVAKIGSHLTALHAPHALASVVAASGTKGVAAVVHGPGAAAAVGAARSAFVASLNELLIIGAIVLFAGALASFALVRARDFLAAGAQRQAVAAPTAA
jgi:EmrB/QacA subfamily drug resistance transporter